MEMVQTLASISAYCDALKPIIAILKAVLTIVQIIIPILLIVLGTIDLGKAVIAQDEKEVKKAQSALIKRCIYAVAIFFVTTIVTLIMQLVGNGASESSKDEIDSTSWATCWYYDK